MAAAISWQSFFPGSQTYLMKYMDFFRAQPQYNLSLSSPQKTVIVDLFLFSLTPGIALSEAGGYLFSRRCLPFFLLLESLAESLRRLAIQGEAL